MPGSMKSVRVICTVLTIVAHCCARDCPGVAIRSDKSGDFGKSKITSSCSYTIKAKPGVKYVFLVFRKVLLHETDFISVFNTDRTNTFTVPKTIEEPYFMVVKANVTIHLNINSKAQMARMVWGSFTAKDGLYLRVDAEQTHGILNGPKFIADAQTRHLNVTLGFYMKRKEYDFALTFRKALPNTERTMILQTGKKAMKLLDLNSDYILGPEFSVVFNLDLSRPQDEIQLEYRAIEQNCSKQLNVIGIDEKFEYSSPVAAAGEKPFQPEPYECLILVNSSINRLSAQFSSHPAPYCFTTESRDGGSAKSRLLRSRSPSHLQQTMTSSTGKLWISVRGLKPIPSFKVEFSAHTAKRRSSSLALIEEPASENCPQTTCYVVADTMNSRFLHYGPSFIMGIIFSFLVYKIFRTGQSYAAVMTVDTNKASFDN